MDNSRFQTGHRLHAAALHMRRINNVRDARSPIVPQEKFTHQADHNTAHNRGQQDMPPGQGRDDIKKMMLVLHTKNNQGYMINGQPEQQSQIPRQQANKRRQEDLPKMPGRAGS